VKNMLSVLFRKRDGGCQKFKPKIQNNSVVSWLNKFCPYFFFLIPGTFYFVTACRTPGWVDATLIVSNVVDLELGVWVNYHNLFHVLGNWWLRLFPSYNLHFYLVLLSALFGVLSVQLMFLVFLEITSSKIVSIVGAIILMISHSLWWHSTMLEVYTLNTAIMAGIILEIIRYNKTERMINLYIASFLIGLGCSNHVLMVLFIFGFLALIGSLIYKRKGFTFARILLVLGFFLIGIGLYLYVFIKDYREGLGLTGAGYQSQSFYEVRYKALKSTIDSATGMEFKGYMSAKNVSPEEKKFWRLNYLIIIIYNYPSAAVMLALFGFYCFWKNRALRLTFIYFTISLIAQIIWSSNFFIWDMYAFALPVYFLLSIPIVFAVHFLFSAGKAGRLILLYLLPTFIAPPFIYDAISNDGKKDGVVKNYFRCYPEWEQAENCWDVVEYITNPNKKSYNKVPEYAQKVFEVLPQEAHFWNSVGRADYPLRLYYRDIYQIRTDIIHHSLFNPFMSHEKAEREAVLMKTCLEKGKPVYIASLLFPERLVLDQLYLLLDPQKDLETVSSLHLETLIDSFPGIEFEKIILCEEEQIWIYRIVQKNSFWYRNLYRRQGAAPVYRESSEEIPILQGNFK